MANLKESARKNDTIDFTLKVKASRKKNGPIEFTMDLNPESKILTIEQTFSSAAELADIFGRINAVLTTIDNRSRLYNDVIEINEKKKKEHKFQDGYEQNFEPSFGKIDKILHKRNSPSESSVSYTRRYNGDKKPD